jgi:hypothetical protein
MKNKLYLSILIVFFTTSLISLVGCNNQPPTKGQSTVSEKSSAYWVEYSKDLEGNVTYYKKENLGKEREKDIIQVSEKMYFSEKGKEGLIQLQKKSGGNVEEWNKLSYVIVLSENDCKNHRQRLLSHTSYDTNGKVLNSVTIADPHWINIVPDSKGDHLQKQVCQ